MPRALPSTSDYFDEFFPPRRKAWYCWKASCAETGPSRGAINQERRTVMRKMQGKFARLVVPMTKFTDGGPPMAATPALALPPAYPIHRMPATGAPTLHQPMPLTGGAPAAVTTAFPAGVPPPPAPYGDIHLPDDEDDEVVLMICQRNLTCKSTMNKGRGERCLTRLRASFWR